MILTFRGISNVLNNWVKQSRCSSRCRSLDIKSLVPVFFIPCSTCSCLFTSLSDFEICFLIVFLFWLNLNLIEKKDHQLETRKVFWLKEIKRACMIFYKKCFVVFYELNVSRWLWAISVTSIFSLSHYQKWCTFFSNDFLIFWLIFRLHPCKST